MTLYHALSRFMTTFLCDARNTAQSMSQSVLVCCEVSESAAKRRKLSGVFRRCASLAIPHRKSFAAVPFFPLVLVGHTNRSVCRCHTNSSMKLPLFKRFQDRFLTTNREKWEQNGASFRKVLFLLENSRRLWLSETRCWKNFPANFDAARKFFTDYPAAQNAIPAKLWAFSGRKIGLAFGHTPGFSALRPPTAFLSFSEFFHVSRTVRIARFESVSKSQPNHTIQCH